MRRMGVALVVLLLGISCTGDDNPVQPSSEQRSELLVYATEHLPNDRLEETAPAGFDVKQVVRHDRERTNNAWVTVGARMEGPVTQSRAIFYVHADDRAALALHVDQVDLTEQAYESYELRTFPYKGTIPPVFEVEGDGVTGTCGVRINNLFWCHAQKGRLYLLVQSSAGGGEQRRITDEQVEAARMVTAAFMELL
jgi:hypothetical protein